MDADLLVRIDALVILLGFLGLVTLLLLSFVLVTIDVVIGGIALGTVVVTTVTAVSILRGYFESTTD